MAKQIACACLVDRIGEGLSLEVKRLRFQNIQVIGVSTISNAENLATW
jgi:hypothetical protein